MPKAFPAEFCRGEGKLLSPLHQHHEGPVRLPMRAPLLLDPAPPSWTRPHLTRKSGPASTNQRWQYPQKLI
jgi:hypothetical protein